MANRSVPGIFESDSDYDVVEGLSTWELINPSDDDEYNDLFSADEEVFAFTDDDGEGEHIKEEVDVAGDDEDAVIGPKEEGLDADGSSPSSDISLQSINYCITLDDQVVDEGELKLVNVYHSNDEEGPTYDEDEEDDYYDEYDLDDELVPMSVRGRFGRERIKKLGKRSCPSMNKTSKKLPYISNRPGCVRGKHGLGVQHSYI